MDKLQSQLKTMTNEDAKSSAIKHLTSSKKFVLGVINDDNTQVNVVTCLDGLNAEQIDEVLTYIDDIAWGSWKQFVIQN